MDPVNRKVSKAVRSPVGGTSAVQQHLVGDGGGGGGAVTLRAQLWPSRAISALRCWPRSSLLFEIVSLLALTLILVILCYFSNDNNTDKNHDNHY